MARTTTNALKAIEERRKKTEERKTINTRSSDTTKPSYVSAGTKEAKTELTTKNALDAIRKRRESEGRANHSSTPSTIPATTPTKQDKETVTTPTKPTSKFANSTLNKTTDYYTELGKVSDYYESLHNKTTIASDLSEEERKVRIDEINSELSELRTARSGLERAKMYGNVGDMITSNEERQTELEKELQELERVGTVSGYDMLQWDIEDAEKRVQETAEKVQSYGPRPSEAVAVEWNNAYSEHLKAQQELEALKEKQKIHELGDVVHTETGGKFHDFFSQFGANYRLTDISEKAGVAMSDYMSNPTEENLQRALSWYAVYDEYMQNNADVLDDKGQVAPLFSDSWASQIAQMKGQAGWSLALGAPLAALGAYVGGGAGAKTGWTTGASIGAGIHSNQVIRGSLFNELISYGMDEETAYKLANDDALIESLIESGETAIDWVSLLFTGGSGNVAKKALGEAAETAAKYASKPLLKLGIDITKGTVRNAGTEYLEEGLQGAVSRATREKALSAIDNEIGQYGKGNIDLYNRPIYKNKDGTVSTVDSITVQVDDKFILLPSIVKGENGEAIRLENTDDIIAHCEKTGEYLGVFDTLAEANVYAQRLHSAQEFRYDENTSVDADDNILVGSGKVLLDAIFGGNKEARTELHEQGKEGFKTGLVSGGIQGTANYVLSSFALARTDKQRNQIADVVLQDNEALNALIEEGKAGGEGTVSEKIATEIETTKESGKDVTREQVKKLIASNEVYIQEEQRIAEQDTKAVSGVRNARNRETPLNRQLEEQSTAKAPLDVEDVKTATGFGENGARLVTEIASQDGMTFRKASDKIKVAYLSGYNGENITFTDALQSRAKIAGIDDRIADNQIAQENAKNATIYNGAFTENEHTKNLSRSSKTMISIFAKGLGMDIGTVDKIIASKTIVDGVEIEHEANAQHSDGKMTISENILSDDKKVTQKIITAMLLHEGGHRMNQLAPQEFGVLMDALYQRVEHLTQRQNLGVSQGMRFDDVVDKYGTNAGLSLDTRGYIEEIAAKELEKIFNSPREFNKWYAEISGNKDVRTAFEKFMDFVIDAIEKIKNALKSAKMTKAERAEYRQTLAELERIKELYANALRAAENVVAERKQEGRTEQAQKNTDSESGVEFSLKNKNLTINSRIPYVVQNNYISVAKGDRTALNTLETKVNNLKNGTYKNDATGYIASITGETKGKAIYPTNKKFNRYGEKHILNLNAMLKLPELFKNAVYVDSKNPQKSKNQNKAIKEYHHFVAPLFMDNGEYRALITAREKHNSNTLYVLRVEVLPTQKRHTLLATQQNAGGSQWLSVPSDISIPELVNGVKIKNYDTNMYDIYSGKDIQFSLKDADYQKAVASGDMVTAQRMVDEAAEKAGYTVDAYHGTGADFNIFSEENISSRNVWGKGFYFGTSKGIADDYASYRESKGGKYRIVSAKLKMDNPFIPHKSSLGTAEEILDKWFSDMWTNSRKLGIGYIEGKLENSPLDLLQFIAEHNNMEIRDVLSEYGYDSVKDGGELVVFKPEQIKSADTIVYDDDGRIIPISERFNENKKDIRYSLKDSDGNTLSKEQQDIDEAINQSMTMEQAKDMIQRAFTLGGIKEWFDGEYKNGDEWLKGEGARAVSLVVENEWQLQQKFLDKVPGVLNGDFFAEDIIEAYEKGTLTGKVKQNVVKRLDTSKSTIATDTRVFAPKEIENAQERYKVASERVTNANRDKVYQARADIIMFAHNRGAAEALGLTQSELNKKLATWARYTARAREVSMRINKDVALFNKWTGIENSNVLNRATVSNAELDNLVNEIKGDSNGWQRSYIMRTMLALDTHIDYSVLNFEFVGTPKTTFGKSVNGLYDNSHRKITVKHNAPHTVAHEMGHFLDYQWARDLNCSGALTDGFGRNKQIDADVKQFLTNFDEFIEQIENVADLRSEYTMDRKEVFARFVSKFVQWVDLVANGKYSYSQEYLSYNDKFTTSQYVEFVRLLQEKSMLDSKNISGKNDTEQLFNQNLESRTDESYTDSVNYALKNNAPDTIKEAEQYTEKEYRNFGWASANNVLNKGQNADYRSKFADAKVGRAKFAKSKSGEYIIPVSDIYDVALEGINNVLVFAKGTIANPVITSVIEIYAYDETTLDRIRRRIYDSERRGIQQTTGGLFRRYYSSDFEFRPNQQRKGVESVRDSGNNGHGKRSGGETLSTEGQVKPTFSLKEIDDLSTKDQKELLDIIAHLKGEFEVTKFAKADPKQLAKMTRAILKDYSSRADYDTVFKAIDELYTYMASGENGESPIWTDVYNRAYNIAEEIVKKAVEVDDYTYNEYKGLREYLRTTPMKFDSLYDSVPASYENFSEFKKRNFGRLLFTKDGASIDSVYQELSGMYPEFFDEYEETSSADQLERMLDVLSSIQKMEVNPFDRHFEQASMQLANDLTSRFFDIPQAKPTFADKAERRVIEQGIKVGKKVQAAREQRDAKIKKLMESQKEKTKKQLDKLREQRDKKVKAEQEKRRKAISKMSEAQKAKILRARITRHAGELGKKLLSPTDKQHIPQDLQGAVAKLLECINLESNYTYDVESGSYKKNDDGLPTRRTQAFNALKDLYEKMEGNVTIDPDLMGADGLLSEVIQLSDKRIVDMTSQELETVWQTLRAVEASISTANKMFAEGKFAEISEMAEALRTENADKKEKTELKGFFGKGKKLATLDMLTPETYLHCLGDAGDAIFRMMRDAQDKHISIMKEVSDFTHKTLKGVNVNSLEKTMHTVKLGGEDVKLSTAQLMELYVLMNREQATEHIYVGGILPDITQGKGMKLNTRANPIRNLTPTEISTALSELTAEEKKIADELQKFVSTVLSDYGNEASMKVYNYEKFLEKNYWTIRTNKQEINSEVGKDNAVTSVANKGMAKGTKPHANTSVRIGSIFDTFASHSSDMATYAAWLGATEDINRIRNFVFWEDGARTGTVKGILDTVHGIHGAEYLQKLMTDISIGVKGTDNMNPFDKLIGSYKAASVGANLRVIIQQPTAILRAMDMIDTHYLVSGLFSPLKGWKKAKQYAPIAQWKDWGYFDINTGRQMKDVLFENASKLEKVKQWSMLGASLADSFAWGQLWNAVEAETRAKRNDLTVGSEEYYNAVAKRFTEIVDHTQVVDGILQRSQIMRSADNLTKMATSFMGEPTKQYNMAIAAAYDAKNSKGDAKKKAVNRLGRTAISLAVAGIINAAAQSIIDAMRDDDKEEDYWEKWLASFVGDGDDTTFLNSNLGDTVNPLNYVPFAKDIVSIIQGYDVKRMDAESITKTINAITNMYKAVKGESKYTVAEASAQLFAEIARLYGVPVANVKRDIKALFMSTAIETNNYVMQYRMEKGTLDINYSGNSKNFMDILYNAYVSDREAYEIIYNDLLKSGYEADKIQSAMETRMKKAAGVDKSSDLAERYMTPETEKQYDTSLNRVKTSTAWKSANETQRKDAEAALYKYLTSTSDDMVEMRAEATAFGVDETEYVLWQLAKDMAESNGNDSLNAKEKASALEMLDLDNSEITYFYATEQADEAFAYGIDMMNYAMFKASVNGLKGDDKKDKVISYANMFSDTEKEYLYFMGTVYPAWKNRSDYIRYFGN